MGAGEVEVVVGGEGLDAGCWWRRGRGGKGRGEGRGGEGRGGEGRGEEGRGEEGRGGEGRGGEKRGGGVGRGGEERREGKGVIQGLTAEMGVALSLVVPSPSSQF